MMGIQDCQCDLQETDFFSGSNIQYALENGLWTDIYPQSTLNNGPLEFEILPTAEEFIDLSNTYLDLQFKITKPDDTNLAATDVVAPVNNILHSLFSDVSISLNNTVIEGGNFNYSYKAYLYNLLSMDLNAKNTVLQSSGWYSDTANKFNDATEANKGFTVRKTLCAESKTIQVCGPLLLDLCLQHKFIPSNIKINLKLTRNKPEFTTMIKTGNEVQGRTASVKINMISSTLHVRKVKALTHTITEFEKQLNLKNCILPLQRTELMTYLIPTGTTSDNRQSIFRGQLPKVIFVGIVANNAYNGSYTTNPFQFKHQKVDQIALYKDGSTVPAKPYTPNFQNNNYTREYMSLLQSMDLFNKSENIGMTLYDFANGYTIYGFNLTPNLQIGGMSQLTKEGNLRLEIQFSTPTTTPLNVICMGVFDAQIEITKLRQIHLNWKT